VTNLTKNTKTYKAINLKTRHTYVDSN
jgi:hypothetical protein